VSHAVNLFDMSSKYADVLTLEKAMDILTRQAAQNESSGQKG
jgi:hypothetical protein